MSELILDTAYFPGIDAAANAAAEAGAHGWAGYIYDPYLPNYNGNWTPGNVSALMAKGLGFLPIYVPGGQPITVDYTVQIMKAYGFNNGPCVIDIEGGSDPGQGYVEAWCAGMAAAGYFPIVYGVESTVAAYSNRASGIWIANYIYHGVVGGLEPNPPGFSTTYFANARAWQYANSFSVAGVDVDASTSRLPLQGVVHKMPTTPPPVPPFDVITNAGHWFDAPNGQNMGPFNAGIPLHIVEVVQDAGNGWNWYRSDSGTWWLVGNADATIVVKPNPVKPPDPVVNPVVNPVIEVTAVEFNALTTRVGLLEAFVNKLKGAIA